MINTLYDKFRPWSDGGSIWLLSDLHFGDEDCKRIDENWITPEQQVQFISRYVHKNDTFICLGDVGDPSYIPQIRNCYKVLILGNHDKRHLYEGLFDEIYDGPLYIAKKIVLSHEPIETSYALNIHGHNHNGGYCIAPNHINLAANVCGYRPQNLKQIIDTGILKTIPDIHRIGIDKSKEENR